MRQSAARWWRPVLLAAGVALAAYTLHDHLPSPSATWRALSAATPGWLAAAAALSVLSMAAFAEQQRHLMAAFGVRIPAGWSLALSYARSAMATALPAGSAISAGYAFRQYRLRGAAEGIAAAVMMLSAVASTAGLAVLYLLILADPPGWTLWAAAAAVVVAGLALPRVAATQSPETVTRPLATATREAAAARRRLGTGERLPSAAKQRTQTGERLPSAAKQPTQTSERLPGTAGRLLDTAAGKLRAAGRTAAASCRGTLALARTVPVRRWVAVLGIAAVNWLTDLACLLAAMHAAGLAVPVTTTATAYLLAQLVRQVPLTPGGIGVIEASLMVALTTAGAAPAAAAAAVLIYRVLSCWAILPIGLACWSSLRPDAGSGSGPERDRIAAVVVDDAGVPGRGERQHALHSGGVR
ncbi:lysylphosphatidylglycerol synthase transmembrane domain-containing protein [Dactylosporangium sp. CA-233914]|uniref:lysylphosphatidylglycerol synthase transmembrane domain-containing protein n=1 Tax=Dactylosporangium sp. CA-233914 TaxID=3239934 RepID=UPI003D91D4CF